MKNYKNILIAIFMGGFVYFIIEIFKPTKTRYYENVYGIRIRTESQTSDYDMPINWIALGLSISVAGIIFILEPFKKK